MPMQKLGGKLYMIRTAQLAGLSERVVPIFQTDHRNVKAKRSESEARHCESPKRRFERDLRISFPFRKSSAAAGGLNF